MKIKDPTKFTIQSPGFITVNTSDIHFLLSSSILQTMNHVLHSYIYDNPKLNIDELTKEIEEKDRITVCVLNNLGYSIEISNDYGKHYVMSNSMLSMTPSDSYVLSIHYNNLNYLPPIKLPGWSDVILTKTLSLTPYVNINSSDLKKCAYIPPSCKFNIHYRKEGHTIIIHLLSLIAIINHTNTVFELEWNNNNNKYIILPYGQSYEPLSRFGLNQSMKIYPVDKTMIYEPKYISPITEEDENDNESTLEPIMFNSQVNSSYNQIYLIQRRLDNNTVYKSIILYPIMLITNHLPFDISMELNLSINESDINKSSSQSTSIFYYIFSFLFILFYL